MSNIGLTEWEVNEIKAEQMSEPFNFNKLDRPGRPTNQELCKQFRELLTKGFFVVDENGDEYTGHELHEEALRATKPWRNKIWQAFREIENRLDPLGAMDRDKQARTAKKTG